MHRILTGKKEGPQLGEAIQEVRVMSKEACHRGQENMELLKKWQGALGGWNLEFHG